MFEMKKGKVKMIFPMFIGESVLDVSKVLIYKIY